MSFFEKRKGSVSCIFFQCVIMFEERITSERKGRF